MEKKLSVRLSAIAAHIPAGSRVADIGTDHGLLPVNLVRSGLAAHVIATDLRADPLAKARRAVREAGLEDQIELRLGSGLSVIVPGEADCIVVAGMGGETIANLLADAPWCRETGCLLLLQPMTKAEQLRRTLARLGLAVEAESLVRENGTVYCVLAARGTDAPCALSPAEQYLSRPLLDSDDPLMPEYLDRQIRRLEKALEGARRSGKACDIPRVREFEEDLSALRRERELLNHDRT
ncbi:MAG: SAM-dependent methyltransferase [Oscillospiraceae bacterium]|nr:SAM-dependent methyltransferase [Oscillospiraceae bacterium]